MALIFAPAAQVMGANVVPNHPLTGVPHDEVIVAIIDTGIDADHPEFTGHRGQENATDPQIVAWWDFAWGSPDDRPDAGDDPTWDPHLEPYDLCVPMCHGTGTASLVGGTSVGAYPGVKLAIAQASNYGGGFELSTVADAIDWAAYTVGADVISVSIGTPVPIVGSEPSDEAVRRAWNAGALPVASAGNGLANTNIKIPSETTAPAYSPHALVVGASGQSASTWDRTVGGYYSNSGPQVTSWGTDVEMAEAYRTYMRSSGTSFSTPLTAGWAASVTQAAMDAGQDASPQRVRQLMMWTADDDRAVPYAVEGFGFVGDGNRTPIDTVTTALAHAANGTLPGEPPLENAAAFEASQLARAATTSAAEGGKILQPMGTSTEGSLGPSTPNAREIDVYTISLQPGETVTATVGWEASQGLNDLDLYLYYPGAGDHGVYLEEDKADGSGDFTTPGNNTESISFRSLSGGEYALLVDGWLVVGEETYTLEASAGGDPATPAFQGDHLGVASGVFS